MIVFNEDSAKTYRGILEKIASEPPSDRQLSQELVGKVKTFVATGAVAPDVVWNFYKEILDDCVRYGAASSFVLRLFDLEPFFVAPRGGYSGRDGSIDKAPWRQGVRR